MRRSARAALALTAAVAINLLALLALTSLSGSRSALEPEPEPTARPAPKILPTIEPPPPRPSPSARSQSAPSSVAPARSELPALPALDAPVEVAIDPALESNLDALLSDLASAQASGQGAPEGLFASDDGGGGDGSRGDAARDAASVDRPPTVRRRVAPRYPLQAERQRVSGHVVVRGLVERDGRVSRVEVLSSSPEGVFEEAAREAFARWEFEPGEDGGAPQRVWVRKRLEFELR